MIHSPKCIQEPAEGNRENLDTSGSIPLVEESKTEATESFQKQGFDSEWQCPSDPLISTANRYTIALEFGSDIRSQNHRYQPKMDRQRIPNINSKSEFPDLNTGPAQAPAGFHLVNRKKKGKKK